MQISKIQKIAFSRAIPTSKKEDFKNTAIEAKRALGIDDGISILKIHSASMPKQDIFDSGIGKLNSKPALDFIEKMAFYTGANVIKEFPKGNIKQLDVPHFCPYSRSATTFGDDSINLLNIVQNKKIYGNILDIKDISYLNSSNQENLVDYRNELALGGFNYPIMMPLKKAYENFLMGYSTKELEEEFEEYKRKPRVSENYPRFAIYPMVAKNNPDLFEDFDNSPDKQKLFNYYKKKYAQDIDFFIFRQFLAQKEHENAKNEINKKGLQLFGDCLIGFSDMEVWANPDAFEKDEYVGTADWDLRSLRFDDILDKNSKCHKIFDDKLSFFLENYDGIRFDVGWCYAISQSVKKGQETKDAHRVDFKHKLYDFIEQRACEIKGKNFDKRNLIYEMDVGDEMPAMFDWSDSNNPKPIDNIRGNVNVLTTEWEHDDNVGWGSPEFFKKIGMRDGELIMGTNNHDGENLKLLATSNYEENIEKRTNNSRVLSKLYNISADDLVKNAKEFIKAKFAQLYTLKNQFLFFIDVLGSDYVFDAQGTDSSDYSFRVDKDFERQYHSALQNGYGFNLMETLRINMKAKSIDKTNPVLYNKVSYYSNYLYEKGAKTEEEANLEEKG